MYPNFDFIFLAWLAYTFTLGFICFKVKPRFYHTNIGLLISILSTPERLVKRYITLYSGYFIDTILFYFPSRNKVSNTISSEDFKLYYLRLGLTEYFLSEYLSRIVEILFYYTFSYIFFFSRLFQFILFIYNQKASILRRIDLEYVHASRACRLLSTRKFQR